MLESIITGVRIAAISSTLPSDSREGLKGKLHYVCNELQTASDLGFDAATRIISELSINKEDIGILLFGSKTPDYRSPNTAAILQGRLELSIDCICFDTNVGANGFIKTTQIAASLLAKANKEFALVIIGDTPSKLQDEVAGTSFELSDAATAVLLRKSSSDDSIKFSTSSSGDNYRGFYLKEGGFRDFNDKVQFDGSLPENYIVRSEKQELSNFFEGIRPLLTETINNTQANCLINTFLLDNLQLVDKWDSSRLVIADASELPLLLENLKNRDLLNLRGLKFITAGEGMALMQMSLNYIPEILPVNYSLDYLQDFKVSHEM